MKNFYKINDNLSMNKISDDEIIIEVDDLFLKLTCDTDIFFKILSIIDEKKNISEVFDFLEKSFWKKNIEDYLNILIDENIIEEEIIINDVMRRAKIGLLGDFKFTKLFKNNFVNSFDIKIYNFLSDINESELDLLIVFLSDITYDEAIKLNKSLLHRNMQYLIFRICNNRYVIGPYIVPWKTACIECLMRDKLYISNKDNMDNELISMDEIKNMKFSFSKREIDSNILNIVFDDLYHHIHSIITKRSTMLTNKEIIYSFNPSLDKIVNTFVSNYQCKSCYNMNKSMRLRKSIVPPTEVPYSLDNNTSIIYFNGGTRSSSYNDSYNKLERSILKMGVNIEIEEDKNSVFRDILKVYHSKIEGVALDDIVLEEQISHGKGLDKNQAYLSAGYELMERISSRYHGDRELINGKPNELRNYVANINNMISIPNEIKLPYDDYDVNKKIDWIWGYSIIDRKYKLVPASIVFISDCIFEGNFPNLTSSGLSAAENYVDAILQGLLEVIEHDSWMIYQSRNIKTDIISYDKLQNENIINLLKKIKDNGFEVVSRNYTTDLNIPVVKTWIFNKDNYNQFAYSGYGASLYPEIALERSITEAIQAYPRYDKIRINKFIRQTHHNLTIDNISLYSLSYFYNKEMKTNAKQIDINNLEFIKLPKSIEESIKIIVDSIKKIDSNADVIVIDLTKKNIGIPVVKVIVTEGIQIQREPMFIVADRTLKYRSNNKLEYKDLYLGPYPH